MARNDWAGALTWCALTLIELPAGLYVMANGDAVGAMILGLFAGFSFCASIVATSRALGR